MQGPGSVPLQWSPKRKQDQDLLQYCHFCKGYKAPRSHHCTTCGFCVLKMDHHCVWINACVGHENHTSFIAFLFFLPIGCIYAVIINSNFLYRLFSRDFLKYHRILPINTYTLFLAISGIAFSIGACIGVLLLLFTQIRAVLRNKTQIEDWICDKAIGRRKRDPNLQPFVYPYDLGWKRNFTQVIHLSLTPVGDGLTWPVRKGCNQYSFTMEQIEQKKEKKQHSYTCEGVREYNGKCCALSYGVKICMCVPCLEATIPVDVGDIIVVTRWRRYWVYGDKEVSEDDTKEGKRIRGWFPRMCIKIISKNDSQDEIREPETGSSKKAKITKTEEKEKEQTTDQNMARSDNGRKKKETPVSQNSHERNSKVKKRKKKK